MNNFISSLLIVLCLSAPSWGDDWYLLQKVDKTPLAKDLNHPRIDGTSIRVRWSTIEPKNDKFNWNYLDKQIAAAKSRGLKYTVRVMAGTNAPKHSYKSKHNGIPTPWENFHKNEFRKMAQALAGRCGSDPLCKIIHVPGFNDSAEFHLPKGNWPHPQMREAWLFRVRVLEKQFPKQKIALNHSPQPFSQEVINGSKEILKKRAAFQMNALKASTKNNWVGYTRIRDLGKSGETIGWQFVGPSVSKQRFGGPFSVAVAKGAKGNPNYWEVYRPDLDKIPNN